MSTGIVSLRQVVSGRNAIATAFGVALALTGAAHSEPTFDPGHGGLGAEPVAARQVHLSALPNVNAGDLASRPRIRVGPLTGVSAQEYASRKAKAAFRGEGAAKIDNASSPASSSPAGIAVQGPTPLSSPLQFSFPGNSEGECRNAAPSNQALAIGDGAGPILQVNQDCLSVWSSTGTRLLGPTTLQAFAGLAASAYVFDPRALYDWHNHRFILAFGDSDLTDNSYYNVAVSQSDDPTGRWNIYRFRTPSQNRVFNDFIRLGQDRQGVYIASNLFPMIGSCCGPYLWEEWILLPKSLLYAASPLRYWYLYGMKYNNVATDSTQPANVVSPYDNPRAEFLVSSNNINSGGGNCVNSCFGFAVWAISNQFGWLQGSLYPPVSSGTSATSLSYTLPPQASQPGAPNSIDTLDTRITGGVTYLGGFLFAALTSGNQTWSDIQSYKIEPSLGDEDPKCSKFFPYFCPRITSATTIYARSLSGGGNFYYYPTPLPDLEGNVTVVFNFSGTCAGCYPSVGYVSDRVTQSPVWSTSFSDAGRIFRVGVQRSDVSLWGRYTAAALAKVGYVAGGAVEQPGVGVAGAYVKADGSWGTQVGYTGFTASNQP